MMSVWTKPIHVSPAGVLSSGGTAVRVLLAPHRVQTSVTCHVKYSQQAHVAEPCVAAAPQRDEERGDSAPIFFFVMTPGCAGEADPQLYPRKNLARWREAFLSYFR